MQSFDPSQLQILGRIHGPAEARSAVREAVATGIDVNVDLMFGLPRQTIDDALADLRSAIALEPAHLSWYQLTIEPKTEFARRPPQLPALDLRADIGERGAAVLHDAGFDRYEVSAYARAGKRCAHNLNYWRFGDYLGIGAGAHGKVTKDGRIMRTEKPKQPRLYLDRGEATIRAVPRGNVIGEFVMNALRLKEGVSHDAFTAATGMPFDAIAETVVKLVDWGLLRNDRLAATEHGYRHLDSVVAEFI